MVDLLRDGLVQAAPGASFTGFIQCPGFGLHTGDDEAHHAAPLPFVKGALAKCTHIL
jgi:hypothetical protein